MIDRKIYIAASNSVLVYGMDALRKLADVAGGELRDATAFQGSLYVCGSFTAVGGVPSYNVARFIP